jgi:hypothetical protein
VLSFLFRLRRDVRGFTRRGDLQQAVSLEFVELAERLGDVGRLDLEVADKALQSESDGPCRR